MRLPFAFLCVLAASCAAPPESSATLLSTPASAPPERDTMDKGKTVTVTAGEIMRRMCAGIL